MANLVLSPAELAARGPKCDEPVLLRLRLLASHLRLWAHDFAPGLFGRQEVRWPS